jgi:hypothetical protein
VKEAKVSKAFKNNMSPGVPKMKGFSPKAPRTVAPMVPKAAAPAPTPHTLMGVQNKKHLPK